MLSKVLGARISGFGTRALDTRRLLDTLLVCAVATILVIRTQLWLSNYPQLGGHGLHIAHLLWGGLGMLVAIVVLVTLLSPVARVVGAVLGGVGLGFFIDELGKFVTSDNNYFFKPTAAIIYIFFIVFYLAGRALLERRPLSERERVVNALELAKDAAAGGMDASEQRRALSLLKGVGDSNPLVLSVRALLESAPVVDEQPPSLMSRILQGSRVRYARLTTKRWFIRVVVAFFVLWALGSLIENASLLLTLEAHLTGQHAVRLEGTISSRAGHFGFVRSANLAASILSGLLVIWGLVLLRRSRRAAYAMFERALLVSLFLTQVFVFLETQFGACIGFVFDVVLLLTVRFMLDGERHLSEPPEREPAAPPDSVALPAG